MIQRRLPMGAPAIEFGQSVMACAGPGLVPGRLVECGVSLFLAAEMAQSQAQIVIRFAIGRIWIPRGQTRDGLSKMLFGLWKFAAPQAPQTQRLVATGIPWVATQRLAPIEDRRAGGVAVLIEMQTDEVEFVSAGYFRRRRRFGGGRGNLALHAGLGLITNQFPHGVVADANEKLRFCNLIRQFYRRE